MPESPPAASAAPRPPEISLAPDAGAVDAAMEAFAAGVAALEFYTPGALAGEVEAVHQFRVSIRKLRAAVEMLAPVLHGSRVSFYRRELPVVGRMAGAVRDCDALADLIRKHSSALDPSIARALTPAYQVLADRRVAAMRALITFLNSDRYRRIVARLSHPLTRKLPTSVTVMARAPIFIRPVVRKAGRAGARLASDSSPPVLHNLRTRLKRLRYSIEMLDRLSGKRTSKALRRLRAMQEELGEHQDLVNMVSWLQGFAGQPAVPPETLIAAGALLQYVNERRVKVAQRACRQWKKFEHGAVMNRAVTEIAGHARARQSTSTNSKDAT